MTNELTLSVNVNEFVRFLVKETRRMVTLFKVNEFVISLTLVNIVCMLVVNVIVLVN